MLLILGLQFLSAEAVFAQTHLPVTLSSKDSLIKLPFVLDVSFKEKDRPFSKKYDRMLHPIRENFFSINSKTDWGKVKTKKEPHKHAIITYYYAKNRLKKVIKRVFRKESQQLIEYYLLNGKLSFVFEKSYYYADADLSDNPQLIRLRDGHTISESAFYTDRYYFKEGQVVRLLDSRDCGAPFSREFLAKAEKSLLNQLYYLRGL